MTSTKFDSYLAGRMAALRETVEAAGARPVLFVGSGASIRYIGAPSWQGLLKHLVEANPKLDMPYNYYYQRAKGDLPTLASLLVEAYQQYAWQAHADGVFPADLYEHGHPADVFMKQAICDYLASLLADHDLETHPFREELAALRATNPHAIITTNYDALLESLFPDFEVIVGQQVIRTNSYINIGEILKIHGSVTDCSSLVLTEVDYAYFMERKKYLSAKLLTYFIEFPLIVVGYSASDTNIRAILADITEMTPGTEGDLLENIWIVQWQDHDAPDLVPPSEKILDLGSGKSARVNLVVSSSFKPVFEALAKPVAVKNVNVKLLRALAANVFNIVTKKSASVEYEVNLDSLALHADDDKLSAVLGFSDAAPADTLHTLYPYTISEVAAKLGFGSWYYANLLLKKVQSETGLDIKASNNRYHQQTMYGATSIRKYSRLTVDLLEKVRDGGEYRVVP